MVRLDIGGSQPDDGTPWGSGTGVSGNGPTRKNGVWCTRRAGTPPPGWRRYKIKARSRKWLRRESAEEFTDHGGEACAFFLAHLHELDAHAVAGVGGADGGAGAYLSIGSFEDELEDGAEGRRLLFVNVEAAQTDTANAREAVARGGAPGDDDGNWRKGAGVAALLFVKGFGHSSLAFRAGTRGES